MELIDFAEAQGQRAAAFSVATLDVNRQRANALLVLLLGGAGAMGGIAISQVATHDLAALAAACVAVWWFALAAWLAMRALRTQPVRSWAGDGWGLLEHAKLLDNYVKQAALEGETTADTLTLLREMELRKAQKALDEYRTASTIAAVALDQAYKGAALTPIALFVMLDLVAVAYRLG